MRVLLFCSPLIPLVPPSPRGEGGGLIGRSIKVINEFLKYLRVFIEGLIRLLHLVPRQVNKCLLS